MKLRRLLTWLLAATLGVVVLAGLALAAVMVVLPLPATRDWVRAELQAVLSSAFDDPVQIGEVGSLGVTGIAVDDLSIGGDTPILRAESVAIDLGVPRWFPPRVVVNVTLVSPHLVLEQEAGGRWNVERWAGPPEEEPEPASDDLGIPRWLGRVGLEIRGGHVEVVGVAPETLQLTELAVESRLWVGILRDSVVELDSASASLGKESRLALHGTYELEGDQRLHAVMKVEPLVGADLAGIVPSLRADARVAGTIEAEGAVAHPKLAIDLTSGDAHVAANGQMQSEEGGDAVTVSLNAKALDPSRLVEGAPSGPLTGTADVSALVAADDLRRLDGTVQVTSSRIDDFEIDSLSAKATTSDGEVRLEIEGSTPDEGLRADLDAVVQLAAPHGTTATGSFELDDPAAVSEGLRTYLSGSRLRGTLDANVADPMAEAPSGTVGVKIEPGHLRGLPFDGADLLVKLTPDLASLERLWIGADRTNLVGHAWVELAGGSDPRAVGGKIRGPASLALFTDAYGVVETDLTFWGKATDLGLALLINSVGPVEFPGLEGTFNSRVDADHLGGAGGEATLKLTGVFSPEPPAVKIFGRDDLPTQVDLSWVRTPANEKDTPPLDRIVLDAQMGTSGTTGAGLESVVESRGDRVHVDLPSFEVRPVVGPKWVLAPPATIDVAADEVEVDGVRIDVGDGRIEATGRVAGQAGPRNDMMLRVTEFDLGLLCELAVVGDECAGTIGAELGIKGAASRPDVTFDLGIDGLVASEQRYGTFRASARTRGDTLAVSAKLDGGEAGTIDLDGALPLEAGGRTPAVSTTRPARVDLRTDDLQVDVLRAFAGRAVRRLDGRATTEVKLRGPLADPRLTGHLDIVDLTFGAAATGATHRGGRVRLSIDPRRFSLDELTLDEGKITAGGHVQLAAGLPESFDLWLALDEAVVVSRSEADVTTSGRLALTGRVSAPHLGGDVTIDRATIRPTIAPGGGAPEPDPSIVVVRRYGTEPSWVSGVPPALGGEEERRPIRPEEDPRANAGTPQLYDDLTMMVSVRLGDPVVVRRYDANIRLSGEVYLTKEPADELRITGGIGGRQGWYIFQGRRFEIRSAYVTFTGETPLDPYLDVEAQYRTGDYLVRIRITGTAKHPSLDLSSDPPLDQSDILAVVLFGKPASQLNDSQGQVLQSQAFALLASYVAPELQRSVLDTFGLTSLTFSMPTGDTAGTIGVGRYFGDDLFVSVARDFGGPSGGTSRQLQGLVGSSVTIQYFLTPSITVQGASSTEGESSMDVIWHRRY